MKVFGFITIMPVLILCGCYSPSAYIQSKMEADYAIDQSVPIVVFSPQEQSDPVRDFTSVLRPQMEEMGFHLAAFEQADYFLFAEIEEEIRGIPSTARTPADPYLQVPAGKMSIPAAVTLEQALPYTKRYKLLRITLKACDLDRYRQDNQTVPVWQGRIDVEETNYQKYRRDCIRVLLACFGKDFEGYVRIRDGRPVKP